MSGTGLLDALEASTTKVEVWSAAARTALENKTSHYDEVGPEFFHTFYPIQHQNN